MIERELDKYIENHYNTSKSAHKNDFVSHKHK